MSNRKTVNTLKTGTNKKKQHKKIDIKKTTNSANHKKGSLISFNQFIATGKELYRKGLTKGSDLLSHIGERMGKMNQPIIAKANQRRELLFQDLETNNVVLLFKSNRKVAVAGFSAVVALAIGIGSVTQYIAPLGSGADTVAQNNIPVSEAMALAPQVIGTQVLASTPDQILPPKAETSLLAKYSGLLKYGPLFESERSCFVLRVNSEPIAYFRTRAEGQALLDSLLSEVTTDTTEVVEIGFAENVTLEFEKISMYQFQKYSDIETVERLVRTGTLETQVYKVQNGDVLSTIAESHGMNLSQLYAANPGVETKKYLQIGDELNLIVPKPMINVKSVTRVTYANAIPYETKKVESAKLYKGETSVQASGAQGEMKVYAEITKVNGKEINRVILNEEVVRQPVERVLAVGTKQAPPTIGTGKFSKPVSRSYVISSRFGSRWGSFHTGIDLAMPTGSAVLAADGGKVVFAGTQSSYGKLVIIDHGGNMQSYYAHNSKLLVSKGDKVFKGQKIALSGNTGRSTGPHLHFEIRVNGVPKNPTSYLNF